jgi:hypothetical protein
VTKKAILSQFQGEKNPSNIWKKFFLFRFFFTVKKICSRVLWETDFHAAPHPTVARHRASATSTPSARPPPAAASPFASVTSASTATATTAQVVGVHAAKKKATKCSHKCGFKPRKYEKSHVRLFLAWPM